MKKVISLLILLSPLAVLASESMESSMNDRQEAAKLYQQILKDRGTVTDLEIKAVGAAIIKYGPDSKEVAALMDAIQNKENQQESTQYEEWEEYDTSWKPEPSSASSSSSSTSSDGKYEVVSPSESANQPHVMDFDKISKAFEKQGFNRMEIRELIEGIKKYPMGSEEANQFILKKQQEKVDRELARELSNQGPVNTSSDEEIARQMQNQGRDPMQSAQSDADEALALSLQSHEMGR